MSRQTTGHYVPGSLAGSRYRAFIPDPLPPRPPLLSVTAMAGWGAC